MTQNLEHSLHIYKYLAEIISEESGIHYEQANYYQLDSRIRKLVSELKLCSTVELYKYLKDNRYNPEVVDRLINSATNNETFFFRDMKFYKILTDHLIPEFITNKKLDKSLKIWSAACSKGQEPYSILMAIREKCPQLQDWNIKIDASDIDHEILVKAKEGIYDVFEVQRGLPITYLTKYFEDLENKRWKIKNELSSDVNFFHFNLLKGPYQNEEYDIVFCRNVLIYQNIENRGRILERIFQSMKPGGFIVLGGGESFVGIKVPQKTHVFLGASVYQKA